MGHRFKRLVGSASRQWKKIARSGTHVYRRLAAAVSTDGNRRKDRQKPLEQQISPAPETKKTEQQKKAAVQPPRVKKKQKPRWSLDDFAVPPVPGRSRFHDFEIDLRIMRGIASENFRYCTPIQEKALPTALAGKDMIARALTGTGKTAVFIIALFCRLMADKNRWPPAGKPRALVLAPTRELAIQIARDGRKLGKFSPIRIIAVYGGADYRKQEEMLSEKRWDVIVATPGRLLDFVNRKVVDLSDCSTLVIDEADRMLDMGFIPDVRRIISRLPEQDQRQTMLFSATITDDVRRLATRWCRKPVSVEAGEETIDVERISQRIYLTTGEEKYTLLYNMIQEAGDGRVLVFTNMKSEASKLTKRLQENGLNCLVLTGDVPQHKRLTRLEAFRTGKTRLLVATDVAGRGIHIEGITLVVNYTLPYEPEDYVHRIGRTGRAGADGIAVSFACETGSFYLPAIEAFIGLPLPCTMPEATLLTPVPEPTAKGQNKQRNRRYRPRSKGNSRPRRTSPGKEGAPY